MQKYTVRTIYRLFVTIKYISFAVMVIYRRRKKHIGRHKFKDISPVQNIRLTYQ